MQLDMRPSKEIISLLRQLTEHHTFFLVSGRVHEDMEKWFLKVQLGFDLFHCPKNPVADVEL
jgi:trehalose-6-phosphatase